MMDSQDFIPTKGSLRNGIVSTIQTHSFNSYQSKKQKSGKDQCTSKLNTNDDFNIKQAKREVIKFGMSGLESKKQEEYKTQLAIKLGAKPPKNKYKNYAVLQQELKKKSKTNSKPVLQHVGKVILQKSNVKRRNDHQRKNMKKTNIIENYGKVMKNSL